MSNTAIDSIKINTRIMRSTKQSPLIKKLLKGVGLLYRYDKLRHYITQVVQYKVRTGKDLQEYVNKHGFNWKF